MDSSSHPQYEVDFSNERQDRPRSYNRQSYSVPIEDVAIPAHLLRATGNLGSIRDTKPTRESLMVDEEKDLNGRTESLIREGSHAYRLNSRSTSRPTRSVSRNLHNTQRSNRRSVRFDGQPQQQDDLSPSTEEEAMTWKRSHHQSWLPGDEKGGLIISRPTSTIEPAVRESGRVATHNPFESPYNVSHSASSSVWINDNPFATRSNSPDGSDKSYKEPENAYTPPGQQQRRGTFGSIFDAVVPNSLARRMTNLSFNGLQRKGSIWKTYENAKKRGVELQRKEWVQVIFEYSIYLFLLCIIYFVLIGRPLWNGAVWWLYWVVENKFVFAGGFSITLGIALL